MPHLRQLDVESHNGDAAFPPAFSPASVSSSFVGVACLLGRIPGFSRIYVYLYPISRP